jgi:hypothetical protein
MNITPTTSSSSSPSVLVAILRMAEQAGPRLAQLGLGWAVGALLAFVAVEMIDATYRAPFEFLKWVAALVSIQYFGRWLHNRRLCRWLSYQIEVANGGPAWNEIPAPSVKLTARSFPSLDEAQGPDWERGEVQFRNNGQDIPAWVAYKGERFEFAGQVRGLNRALADNERLFGNLLYVKPAPKVLLPVAEAEPKSS